MKREVYIYPSFLSNFMVKVLQFQNKYLYLLIEIINLEEQYEN